MVRCCVALAEFVLLFRRLHHFRNPTNKLSNCPEGIPRASSLRCAPRFPFRRSCSLCSGFLSIQCSVMNIFKRAFPHPLAFVSLPRSASSRCLFLPDLPEVTLPSACRYCEPVEPASSHHAGHSSFGSYRLPVLLLGLATNTRAPRLLQEASPTDCASRLHRYPGTRIISRHGCELLAHIAQSSLSDRSPGLVQDAVRLSTLTKVQSDRDLLLIPTDCIAHKASSLPTRSMARAAHPAFSSNLVRRFGGHEYNAHPRGLQSAINWA